jgi:hypothetical protein
MLLDLSFRLGSFCLRQAHDIGRLQQPVVRAEKVPASLALKRVFDQFAPLFTLDVIGGRIAGDAERLQKLLEIVGAAAQIRTKNLLQAVLAEPPAP